jgi:type I restriction enzyme S subunit
MPENTSGAWPSKPLREVAQVVSGGTPSRYVAEFWEDGNIPWVTPTDLTNTSGRFLSDTREKITHRGLTSCSATLLPAGTLLMTSRATLGEIRIAEREVCTNQGFKSLVPFHDTHGRFLYYQMLQNKERYRALGIGSTFLEVNKRDTERFEVLVPPDYGNQQRIADILSTVDEAIEQTEALIAKTQQIKAGLMQDLFTRGVTADGQLRPTREEATQLYKESPLGWIPKGWGCKTLDSLLAPVACPMRSGPFGSALLKEELVENGIPLLGIDNVFTEAFVAEYRRFVTPHKFVELSRYAVLPGDVIITIMGTVGRCCVVPEDADRALSSKHLWTMTFDRNKVLPELVCWQLNYAPWVKSWFSRQSQGAVMDAIQSSTLRTLRLPVPPPSEQMLLRDRYVAVQARLSQEDESLRKLLKVKRGLMEDLLTGAVSVEINTSRERKEVAANV